MASVEDDKGRPEFSYKALIGMAILCAPDRRLTLAEIYRWILNTYPFYELSQGGWQNCIRRNLTANEAFIKVGRPKNGTQKGNWWEIKSVTHIQPWRISFGFAAKKNRTCSKPTIEQECLE